MEFVSGILAIINLPAVRITASLFIFSMVLYGTYLLKRDYARLAEAKKMKEKADMELVKVDKKLKELVSQYKVNMEKRKRGEK